MDESLLDEGSLCLRGCFSLMVNLRLSLDTVDVNSRLNKDCLNSLSSSSDVSAEEVVVDVVETSDTLLDDHVLLSVATRFSIFNVEGEGDEEDDGELCNVFLVYGSGNLFGT